MRRRAEIGVGPAKERRRWNIGNWVAAASRPPLGLGTGNFADATPEKEASRIIHRSLDAGINLIDTGNSYSDGESERIVGRILVGGNRRHETILATKVF